MKTSHATHHAMIDEAFRKTPFTFYDQLRRESPVVWDENLNAWLVTRHADVQHVFQDPAHFSSDRLGLARERFTDPKLKPLLDTLEHLMLQNDDPVHTRLRRLVTSAFQRKAVESYAPKVEKLAETLIAPARDAGQMEFVADFAVPLPVIVISEILGIPAEDRDQVKRWCDDFSIIALNFYAQISDAQLQSGLSSVMAFSDYLEKQVALRRGKGREDLLSHLIEAEDASDGLTFPELLANSILLLNAGNETTSILLTNLLHAIATMPELAATLRADPSLIPHAVEESLRIAPPVHFLGRLVKQDTELGGQRLRAGDLVLIFMASADHDPSLFENPGAFDLARGKIAHLSFGSGPHICAGLQLARLEAKITVATMLESFSTIELAETDLSYGPNLNLRGFTRLPLLLSTE